MKMSRSLVRWGVLETYLSHIPCAMDAASVFLELALVLRDAGAGEEMRSVDAEARCLGAIVNLFGVGKDGWGRAREIECSCLVMVSLGLRPDVRDGGPSAGRGRRVPSGYSEVRGQFPADAVIPMSAQAIFRVIWFWYFKSSTPLFLWQIPYRFFSVIVF